jgi:cysteinyl-tRNA synthetase
MGFQIYNTMTQRQETFESLVKGQVKLYVCGPTVYQLLHVGNFRGPVVYNMLRNWLKHLGYKVTYVYNYTDVDDKIINSANEEGVSSSELSSRFIQEFEKDYGALGLSPHDANPKVTDHMPDIVRMIEKIIENGNAYVKEGEVFFSIDSFKDYGKLSHKNIADLIAGTRVEVDPRKKNPMDFSLWKPAKPGEPKWPSPWSEGRPGWHIECSAMNCAIHGEQIDIHGGGIDLIFPHHENEIAQSEAANGKPFSKYWMHNNFINMSGEKMSKSIGNIVTMREFIEQYDAEIYKYMILSAHYRSQLDFSRAQASNATAALGRIYSALALAQDILVLGKDLPVEVDKAFEIAIKEVSMKVEAAFNDDLNTPTVMALIFEMIRGFNASYKRGQKVTPQVYYRAKAFTMWVGHIGKIMALFVEEPKTYLRALDDRLLTEKNIKRSDIDKLIVARTQARASKDFKIADEVRAKLDALGISVQDTPEGTVWEVQK